MKRRQRDEAYYTIAKIQEIIKDYKRNMRNLKEQHQEMRSFGVAQYGEEAGMPSGNSISNVVENEAIRRVEADVYWQGVITDIKYVQDRWYRITDEQDAMAFNLRLEGYNVSEIARVLDMDRSNVYRILKRVAVKIKGCELLNNEG